LDGLKTGYGFRGGEIVIMWYSWLAYIGAVAGLGAAGIFGISPLRCAGIGLAAGFVIMALWNFVDPTPAPCLQSSKGWDILRAYSLCR
jgi:hypothetical protein